MTFKQPAPYKDILIANKEPGLNYKNIWGVGVTNESFERLYSSDMVLFSGYYHDGETICYRQTEKILSNPLTGSFASIHVLENEIVAKTDIFGLSFLYLYQHGDIWALSNRYEMILDWASSCALPLQLNTSPFIRGLTSIEQCFSQRHSRECDFSQIRFIALDESVIIKSNGVSISKNTAFTDLLEAHDENYDQLIDAAAQEIKNNTRGIFNSGGCRNIICDLSGGFDSRLVFAAIVGSGNADKVAIRSNPVANSLDLEIATTIADSFGLSYLSAQHHPQHFTNATTALGNAASYFLGEYYSYGTTAWSCEGKNTDTCRVSGGGGELYRAINLKSVNASSKDPANFTKIAVRELANLELFSTSDHLDTLQIEVDKLPGDATSKTEFHYIFYRNRIHYGMRAWDTQHECVVYQPAISINLFKASRCLSAEERSIEKAMLDVTNRMLPVVTCFPYATKGNFNTDILNQSDPTLKNLNLKISAVSERWEESQNSLKASILENRRKINASEALEWREINNIIKSEALKHIEHLAETIDDAKAQSIFNSVANIEPERKYLSLFLKIISLGRQIEKYYQR